MLNVRFPAWLLVCVLVAVFPVPAEAGQNQFSNQAESLPFRDGEKLTYEISWSNILQAGTAVMEVRQQTTLDGRNVYHLVSTAKSAGFISRFYKVSDRVESTIDAEGPYSLSYRLDQQHGKRKKQRLMTFDRAKNMVRVLSDGVQQTYPVPGGVQDALSSLYYIRTQHNFVVGKPIVVTVHEDDKTWLVEVHTLGREKVRTPLGECNTIKLKTYPRYDGVFQNKGEIYIWLTDDARRIPVLMKSTISIGSIVSTLVDIRSGEEKNDITHRIKATVTDH